MLFVIEWGAVVTGCKDPLLWGSTKNQLPCLCKIDKLPSSY